MARKSKVKGPQEAGPKRAVVYCRVSTQAQAEEGTSLATQQENCLAHAAEMGWTVVEVVSEQHSGGDYLGRMGLQRALATIEDGGADVLLAYAVDRVSRHLTHLGAIMSRIESAGATLDLVTEDVEDSPTGKLLLSVRGYAAEMEKLKIVERTMRGKRARVAQGKVPGFGSDPYGWRKDRERGVLVINEAEAVVVRRIFAECIAGKSLRGICRDLNLEGIPAPSARRSGANPANATAARSEDGKLRGLTGLWSHTGLRRILQNENYAGACWAWRGRSLTGKRHTAARPREEWIKLPEGTIPAIIDAATFAAAQHRLATNTGAPVRNERAPRLLRGLARCAKCGQPMYPEVNRGRAVYRCASRMNRTRMGVPCGAKMVAAEPVEAAVWEGLSELLRDPHMIAWQFEQAADEAPDGLLAERDEAAKALTLAEKKLGKLVALFAEADDAMPIEAIKAQMAQAEAMRKAQAARLAEIDAALAGRRDREADAARMAETIAAIADRIGDADFAARRDAVEALVDHVALTPNEANIRLDVSALFADGGLYTTC